MTEYGGVTIDNAFAQVPEWLLDAPISDGAVRLYAVLIRYADYRTMRAFPSRQTLADRLRKSLRTVDGYIKELCQAGALRVTHKYSEGQAQRANDYVIITAPPRPEGCAADCTPGGAENCARGAQQTAGEGAQQTAHITITRKNDNQKNDKKKSETASAASDAAEFAADHPNAVGALEYFDQQVEANGFSRPGKNKRNRDAARLLIERDGHDEAEIRQVMDWALADEFWRTNIRSMSKFREKYETLRAQMSRRRSGPDRRTFGQQKLDHINAVTIDKLEGSEPEWMGTPLPELPESW